MRNPTWSRDELILALDLFFRHNPRHTSEKNPEIIELSRILNRLPIHNDRPDAERFRNASGVYMKMANFLRFDPTYEGSGLKAGGKLEEEIWNEFVNDKEHLHNLANAIRLNVDAPTRIEADPSWILDKDEEAPEGKVLLRHHKVRERNIGLVRKKKSQILKSTGRLACEVCNFDFAQIYGVIGESFIECHHTKPISTLSPGDKTNIQDLALVCANCHRMLHKGGELLGIEQLKTLISERRKL